MKLNNQELSDNSENSDDVYMSDDSGGVRYVKDGEDFDIKDDAPQIGDKNEIDENVLELDKNDLEAKIEKAKEDAEKDIRENKDLLIKNAKTRGAPGQALEIQNVEDFKRMLNTQGTMLIHKGSVWNLDDPNLVKEVTFGVKKQTTQNSLEGGLLPQRSKSGLGRKSVITQVLDFNESDDDSQKALDDFILGDQKSRSGT